MATLMFASWFYTSVLIGLPCVRQNNGVRGFGIQSPEDYRWRLRIAAAAKFR